MIMCVSVCGGGSSKMPMKGKKSPFYYNAAADAATMQLQIMSNPQEGGLHLHCTMSTI